MNTEERINQCVDNTRNAMVKLDACQEQLNEFDDAIKEFLPIFSNFFKENGYSPTTDLLNLVYRYTSIGSEFYLRENVSGSSKSLNNTVNW